MLVSFTHEQISAIREYHGTLGEGDATIVKTIVIHWLLSHNSLSKEKSTDNITKRQEVVE